MKGNGVFKRIITGIILAALAVIASGCSGGEDRSLQKVLDKGEFVLGYDHNHPPSGYLDENGNAVGFDIDLAREVCDRMGIKLICKDIDWDQKEKLLKSGKIDCIWNGLTVNEMRAREMNLSEPYMQNTPVFVVAPDSDIEYLNDLKGKFIGIQSGHSAEESITESSIYSSITIVEEENNDELFDDLYSGQIDAIVLDSVVAYYFLSEGTYEFKILSATLKIEDYAVGFRKGDDALMEKVEEILHEMKEDGTLANISIKWFGKDVTTLK